MAEHNMDFDLPKWEMEHPEWNMDLPEWEMEMDVWEIDYPEWIHEAFKEPEHQPDEAPATREGNTVFD